MRQTRILIADDDLDHRTLLRRAIAQGGPSVSITAASNRDELLDAARRARFDCIVLDSNLPPYTTTELIREIAPLQENVPCIVVSSSEEQAVVIHPTRNGVAEFIKKDEAISGSFLWERIGSIVASARSSLIDRRVVNRRIRQLQIHANTDALTGLMNRRGLEAALRQQGRHGNRRKNTAAILIDLDHFKRVNETLGHAAGDRVLRQAAAVIRELAAPADILARWGGDEFLILRQSSSVASAWMWADQIRAAIQSAAPLPDGMGRQTASIGVDLLPTNALSSESFVRADRAMYLAKDSGRDRVCTWQMVAATDAAHDLGCRPDLTARDRLKTLINAVDASLGPIQREHTGPHGRLVRDLANSIGERLLRSDRDRANLALAAEFHDIGKIGVPESLLALPRRLSVAERRLVKEHARLGAELFRAVGAPDRAASAVDGHHDPFGPGSDEAPEPAGKDPDLTDILSVCDAVVAMRSPRPYAEPIPFPQVMAELRAGSGSQFHPRVVADIHAAEQDRRLAA